MFEAGNLTQCYTQTFPLVFGFNPNLVMNRFK